MQACCRPLVLILSGILLVCAWPLNAAEFYVDNLLGEDIFSGRSREPQGGIAGPVRTIEAALKRARGSDTIHLVNRDIPYFETINISGPRFANRGQGGLRIEGNGAIVSGVFRIPPNCWKYRGNDVWSLRPMRKAHYQLVHFDRAVPETTIQPLADEVPEMPPGNWGVWKGVIYYQADPRGGRAPDQLPLGLASKDVGISIHDVNNVWIRNLTLRHFRLDGVNVHDRARGIVLENVRSIENGRSGLAVGGASQAQMIGGELRNNRLAEVWNSEVGLTELEQVKIVPGRSGLGFRVLGGKVISDGSVFEPIAMEKESQAIDLSASARELSHQETLAWIQQNRGWRRVRKTKPIWARAVSPAEVGKAFQTADRAVETARLGDWLSVGAAGEPWFQKPEKIDAKYDRGDVETKQFSFDDAPREYVVFLPKPDVWNWAAQIVDPAIKGFVIHPGYDPKTSLFSPSGGYVVKGDVADPYADNPDDVWLVQQPLFQSTYEFAEPESAQ